MIRKKDFLILGEFKEIQKSDEYKTWLSSFQPLDVIERMKSFDGVKANRCELIRADWKAETSQGQSFHIHDFNLHYAFW